MINNSPWYEYSPSTWAYMAAERDRDDSIARADDLADLCGELLTELEEARS